MNAQNLFLVGYRCSGKSTVGRFVANQSEYSFLDMDHYIERKTGQSIREFWANQGEEAFRSLEEEVLVQVSNRETEQIVATGGGIVESEQNRELLRNADHTIWLRSRVSVLEERLRNQDDRPSLTGKAPEKEVKTVLEKRRPLYREVSDAELFTDEQTVQQTAENICGSFASSG